MWKKRIEEVDFLGKLCEQNYYHHCRIIDMLTKGTKSDVINDSEVREWPTLLTTVLIQTVFSWSWFVLYRDSDSGLKKKITPATRQEEYQIVLQFSFVCICIFFESLFISKILDRALSSLLFWAPSSRTKFIKSFRVY